MDDQTRCFIESLMDDLLKDEIVKDVEWVQEDIPLSSFRDMALGYAIGNLNAAACYTIALRLQHVKSVTKEREEKEVMTIIKRRLPENYGEAQ